MNTGIRLVRNAFGLRVCRPSSVLACLFAAAGLQAGTVALWPLDWDVDNQAYDLRSATGPAYDLTAMKPLTPVSAAADTLPWNLPPNPDTSGTFLFAPVTRTSLATTPNQDGYLQGNVGDALAKHKAYTVEGWVRLTSPRGAFADWIILVHSGDTQLRIWPVDDKYYLHVWSLQPSLPTPIDASFVGPGLSAAQLADGAWHHWAYTHTPDNGNGQRVFEAFWDGQSMGTLTGAAVPPGVYTPGDTFMLGTRGNYGNTLQGALEYVRISDKVLAPAEFLCAGGAGTVETEPVSTTVGYWRLGCDAQGGVDGDSVVSGTPFRGAFMSGSGNDARVTTASEMFSAHGDCAFAGQPPNATAVLTTPNAGSFVTGLGNMSRLKIPGLGAALVTSRDFTIETYFRPDHRAVGTTGSRFLFGTQPHAAETIPGWTFLLCSNARTSVNYGRRFRLLAVDGDTGTPEYFHTDLCSSLLDWNDTWKHLALVHRATGGTNGFGRWDLFVDGACVGTLNDTRALGDASTDVFYFGRNESYNTAFGRFDLLRVSGAALAPDQFLCAQNGREATDVLAFFPFDRAPEGSAYSSADDLAGTYGQGIPAHEIEKKYRVAAVADDAPVVTNPDVSPGRSACAETTGSLAFHSADCPLAQLICQDPETLRLFNLRNSSYTIELFLKRTEAVSGTEHVFFGSTTTFASYWPSMDLRLAYSADGFLVSDLLGDLRDVQTSVRLPDDDAWHHVALMADMQVGTNTAEWRLYVDGVCKWTSEKTLASRYDITALLLGGRTWSASSWRGRMAHLRISRAALAPAAFLNAPAPAVEPAATQAYWPLDFKNGVLDLGERLANRTPFVSDTVAGSTERAVLKAATATVAAEAVVNRGSVAMANGATLVAPSAAAAVAELDRPFTLEGYVKWTGSANRTCQMVCGTYRNDHGWKLVLDNQADGGSVLRLFGTGRLPTSSFVNASFGALPAGFAGSWRHLALSYRPVGTGVWTLAIDGQTLGEVENAWNVAGSGIRQSTLLLGSLDAAEAFEGAFDVWRLTHGVRDVAQLLYPGLPVPGLTLFVR